MKVLPINDTYFVAVDDEDYDYVAKLKWKFRKGYAYTTRWERSFALHQLIMRFPNSAIDHIDRDTRNNQNLICVFAITRKMVETRENA